MLDKSLEYRNLLMRRPAGAPIPEAILPPGYSFSLYQPGDETHWARIETAVLEFDDETQASDCVRRDYLDFHGESSRRMLFIREPGGLPVATFTAWWQYTGQRRDPWVHWVGVHPEHQSRGLGRAIVAQGVRLMADIEGDRDFYLHTQTWSHRAVGLYLWAGFRFLPDGQSAGGSPNENAVGLEVLRRAGFTYLNAH